MDEKDLEDEVREEVTFEVECLYVHFSFNCCFKLASLSISLDPLPSSSFTLNKESNNLSFNDDDMTRSLIKVRSGKGLGTFNGQTRLQFLFHEGNERIWHQD